jgi:hypothetical protein
MEAYTVTVGAGGAGAAIPRAMELMVLILYFHHITSAGGGDGARNGTSLLTGGSGGGGQENGLVRWWQLDQPNPRILVELGLRLIIVQYGGGGGGGSNAVGVKWNC